MESLTSIPKIIHYCWFGGKALTKEAQECIASWRKFFPDYEIREWNESNYLIEEKCDYVKKAYEAKKWAFVSDYARFEILYKYGGIYFDTDVEVIKSFDDIIEQGNFFGKEIKENEQDIFLVNPGLGMGTCKNNKFYKMIIDIYNKAEFSNGEFVTVCKYVTNLLKNNGYSGKKNDKECVMGINIYPTFYFCPMNYYTGEINIDKNTYSIHLYLSTWFSKKEKKWLKIERKLVLMYGHEVKKNFFYKLVRNLYCFGFIGIVKKIMKKIRR